MTHLDDFGKAYLSISLEINKHLEGYVDAYYGPADLKAEIESGEKKSLQNLTDDLAHLRDLIPTDNPSRHSYLTAIMRAMDCTLRTLNGEEFEYLDEVYRIFDINPEPKEENDFIKAHKELDTLLPSSGNLGDRLELWRKQYTIPNEKLIELLDITHNETRKRTQEFVDLMEDEAVEVTLTSGQPWSAYNWYKGNARSQIDFNTDIPVSALDLVELFAHEAYPGHHTELQIKEKLLYHDKLFAEQAVMILHSPTSVVSEGIAMTAAEIIFPNDSHYDWTAEVLLPAADLPVTSGDELRRINGACRKLLFYYGGFAFNVLDNAALKYHSGEFNEEQTIDYYRTYGLVTEESAKKVFDFLAYPMYRAYVQSYTQGYNLIDQAAHGKDKKTLFKRLLTEEMLPSNLASM
jgi:hypothetical protein